MLGYFLRYLRMLFTPMLLFFYICLLTLLLMQLFYVCMATC